MASISEDEDDENVALVPENQNQGSSASAPAENSIELIDGAILSNQEAEPLNSLIMIGRRNKVRHDYKQLNTRGFAKAAKPVIAASHQIATLSTYEEAISRSQVSQ
jgi:uncharacterized protein YutE (UPF0331/DUF86 family)